jgi:integrase
MRESEDLSMYLIRRNMIYYIRYLDRYENRLKQVSTKTTNKRQAHQFLTNFEDELKHKKKLAFISLDNFRREYLDNIKILHSAKYYDSIRKTFNNLITNAGDIPLIRLDRVKLEKFLLQTYEKAKHNAWHYYRNLRAAFNYAVNRNYIDINPLQGVKLPKIPNKLNLYISESEFDLILDKTEDKQLKDLFKFAINSGLRLGEIVNLKWSAVSFTDYSIKIESDETFKTKGNRSRIIPLNATLFDILKDRYQAKVYDFRKIDSYVFHKQKVKFNPDYISKKFKRAVRDAMLNDEYHFHLLRASFISNLAKRNVPLVAIQRLVGHTSIKITEKHYLSVQNDLLVKSMLTLDRINKSASEGF